MAQLLSIRKLSFKFPPLARGQGWSGRELLRARTATSGWIGAPPPGLRCQGWPFAPISEMQTPVPAQRLLPCTAPGSAGFAGRGSHNEPGPAYSEDGPGTWMGENSGPRTKTRVRRLRGKDLISGVLLWGSLCPSPRRLTFQRQENTISQQGRQLDVPCIPQK